MSDFYSLRTLRSKAQDEIDRSTDLTITGTLGSIEHYRAEVARIRAFTEVLSHIAQIEDELRNGKKQEND